MFRGRVSLILPILPIALVLSNGCTSVHNFIMGEVAPSRDQPEEARGLPPGSGAEDEGEIAEPPRRRESVPPSPKVVSASGAASRGVLEKAMSARGTRIVVSIDARALWLMRGDQVLHSAPVAVGMQEGFTFRGTKYDFRTPIGVRKVLAKALDPIWTPPDWHYFEKVVQRGLDPVQLRPGMEVELADGSRIEVRGEQVGRVNQSGHFAPFTPGNEILFDGKIFIPPFGTQQRRIPEILGTHKLELGDGYLIHGTPDRYTIGEAVSHGCVRMYNEDVARLYEVASVGTTVYIF